MSRLRYPLIRHLRDPANEEGMQRIAQEIDARFPRPRRRGRLPVVLAVTAAVAAAGYAVLALRDAGPLRLADGHAVLAVEAPPVEAGETGIALSDGSHIRLFPGTRLEPLQSTGTIFSAMLVRGGAEFDVRPGGPRHWVIECGLATVEVVGTQFACERTPGHLHVAVSRGAVLVRGERVPDRVRRLAAGQSIDVSEDALRPVSSTGPAMATVVPLVQSAGAAPAAIAAPDGKVAHVDHDESPSRNRAKASWRDLAKRGRHREAFLALGVDGLRRESRRLGVTDLLALADVARLSGHPADAVAPLERILTDFASDAQAPLAAFALGRLELDSLRRPERAIVALNQALHLGIPRSLREDVRARLVEACARSGQPSAARAAADAYFLEFPHGRHARAIERWLDAR
jgi:transmembrane sensor